MRLLKWCVAYTRDGNGQSNRAQISDRMCTFLFRPLTTAVTKTFHGAPVYTNIPKNPPVRLIKAKPQKIQVKSGDAQPLIWEGKDKLDTGMRNIHYPITPFMCCRLLKLCDCFISCSSKSSCSLLLII